MDLQTAETVEILSMASRGGRSPGSSSSSSTKRSVPMHIDYETLHLGDKDESGKLRRPVRPVDRQRMRPWLMELLDLGNVYGLSWTNRPQGVFQISWRHASRLGWNLETDGDVFERWARHTGIYKEGDPPEPKRWKANFRCALHSLHDVVELTTALERRGRNACRTYRFLHSTDERSVNKKRAKARKSKEYHRYERPAREEVVIQEIPEVHQTPVYEFVTTKILANEDLEPATESDSEEDAKQDRVIVQQLELKNDEDLGLHHDHDYSVIATDKSQKTIVFRQGIGSIVLHKEVLNAPEGEVQISELQKAISSSNLDQLASAAVGTAGWNTVLAPGLSSSAIGHDKSVKHKIKTKLNAKELAAARLMRNEDERAAYSLKYLLTGNAEDAAEPSPQTARLSKKRKTESSPDHNHPSISVGAEETVSTEATLDADTDEFYPYVPPKVSKIPRKTASPRILQGAKARRQRSKSEKTDDSESTEPLMSSCLLLLEAATRLDNAEKEDKTTDGVRTRGKTRGSARTSVTSAAARAGKIIKKQQDSDSDEGSESSSNHQGEDTMVITADQDLHRVLRKTLESLKNRNLKLPKQAEDSTITIDLGEGVWSEGTDLRDTVVVVSETDDVKGLFSGSHAESDSSVRAMAEESEEAELKLEDNEQLAVELADTAMIEETVVDNGEGTEYIEMVIPEEENIAYIEGDSVPREIIIETVEGDKDQSSVLSTTAVLEDIPAGSFLLQTGDGTPIGIIDAQGKLTSFQSAEARSVISILSSKGTGSDLSTAFAVAAKSSNLVATSPEVPRLSTSSSPLKQESPQPGSGEHSMSSVVVKQEPVVEEASINQALMNTDTVVKVERFDPAEQESLTMSINNSTNGFLSDAEAANLQSLKGKISQYLAQTLLDGLVFPYTYEEILSNFKKSLLKAKSSFPPGSTKNIELFSSVKLERLEDLCKTYIVGQCFAVLGLDAALKATATKALTRQSKSKKITVLPGVQLPKQRQQALRTNSDAASVIDPTTPFSLGEIPLFASTKGDSDSMSPPKGKQNEEPQKN